MSCKTVAVTAIIGGSLPPPIGDTVVVIDLRKTTYAPPATACEASEESRIWSGRVEGERVDGELHVSNNIRQVQHEEEVEPEQKRRPTDKNTSNPPHMRVSIPASHNI